MIAPHRPQPSANPRGQKTLTADGHRLAQIRRLKNQSRMGTSKR